MVLTKIETLLKAKMGLDAVSIGTASVERAVRQRLAACEQDMPAYWEHICNSQTELQELIEAVVVGETWFFRDREAFSVLVSMAQEQGLRKIAHSTLRLLSLPCSTGEEPYSMAMALLDAGFPVQHLQIDAVDISARAIAYAERGVYGSNSFRGQDLAFRERYFSAEGRRYRLNEAARRPVRFQHGNLLTSGWLPGAHCYDAIFCRNVLIYFDRPTQERALEVLGRLLLPSGLLFVGPSETALLMDHAFVSVPMPRAFAFRKPQPGAKTQPRAAVAPPLLSPPSSSPPPKAKPAAPGATRPKPTRPKPEQTTDSRQWIEEAQKLANEGRLIEAMQSCERHLRSQPASGEAFYLIGLLHDAAHHPRQAAEYYRKALYLDPKHHEALVHLAVVLEKDGDAQGAQRMFERAKRVAAK